MLALKKKLPFNCEVFDGVSEIREYPISLDQFIVVVGSRRASFDKLEGTASSGSLCSLISAIVNN